MTLLETIRLLDAPYVVWLDDAQFAEFILNGGVKPDYPHYRYGQSIWCHRTWVYRMDLEPTDTEIDACLAGAGV